MKTSNTPLTDAASKRFDLLHCTGSDYDLPAGMYVARLDMHLLELRTKLDMDFLKLRLHAAEELLREAQGFVHEQADDEAFWDDGDGDRTVRNLEARIHAHLANAANPSSATTTKETTK